VGLGDVTQVRPSSPGPARVGVTTHERLRLMGMTFRTEATIDRVEAGRLLQWRAHDRQKQLQGSRLVEPTGPTNPRFTEVVEGHSAGSVAAAGGAAAPAASHSRYAAETAPGSAGHQRVHTGAAGDLSFWSDRSP
jgi:hypothetical protein